jgi:high-affinity nickel-transport protein
MLFAAGMTLMDTLDGVFMTHAYGWAFAHPVRKLYYSTTVTSLSVAVALTVELLQVASAAMGTNGSFWQWIQAFDFKTLDTPPQR